VNNYPIRIPSPLGGGATTSIRIRKKKLQQDEGMMRTIVDKVRDCQCH